MTILANPTKVTEHLVQDFLELFEEKAARIEDDSQLKALFRRQFSDHELLLIAEQFDYDFIDFEKEHGRLPFKQGRLLYIMERAGLFRVNGKANSFSGWHSIMFEDDPQSYQRMNRYKTIYDAWHPYFEIRTGDRENPTIEAMLHDCNQDILVAYGVLITPENALAWAVDGAREVIPRKARDRRYAALEISKSGIPLSKITPLDARLWLADNPTKIKKRKITTDFNASRMPVGHTPVGAKRIRFLGMRKGKRDTFTNKYEVIDRHQ